jgi:leucyl aminopeptidase (aminopeptidase T)
MRSRNVLSQFRVARRVQKLLATDLKIEIQARVPLEKATRGPERYTANMTAGKVLVMPGLRSVEASR